VSVKLTPEICINKASSYSRLTAVGKQATASDSYSQNCLQTHFFSPYLWWDNNWTTPACWKTYWNCIAFELGTLCGLLFCFVLFCFVLVFFPFDETRQNYFWDTISRVGGWGTYTKIMKTETLLHLNLEIFFNIFLNLFIFYFYFYYFYFYFQSPLSLMTVQLTID
jgi:hypothetical protein